jgi:Leucine-rich repeat (LRR) protein
MRLSTILFAITLFVLLLPWQQCAVNVDPIGSEKLANELHASDKAGLHLRAHTGQDTFVVGATDPDLAALTALYESTNGENWTYSLHWLETGLTHCRWYGVCCGFNYNGSAPSFPDWENGNFIGSSCKLFGRVTALTLNSNALEGALPDAVGQLTHLVYLDLRGNGLIGSIPDTIYSIADMKYVSFTQNNLSGSISPLIGNWQALTYFSVRANQLNGEIPTNLGTLSQIFHFDAQHNALTGTIPSSVGNLLALEKLYVGLNALTGSIPPEFGLIPGLKVLYLFSNRLEGSIPEQLSNCQQLQQLGLHYNQLGGTVPSQLGTLQKLEELYLNDNLLVGTIPAGILTFPLMKSVELYHNQFSGPVPAVIPGPLVEKVDLAGNKLEGSFPSFLFVQNTSIQRLYLQDNNFDGTIPSHVFVGSLKIKTVNLANNRFSGSVPETIGKMLLLEELDLSNNRFTGGIPASLLRNAQLRTLKLQHNSLDSDLPPETLPDYKACTENGFALQTIDISFNKFSGSLSFFQYHSNLNTLIARNNALNGIVDLQMFEATMVDGVCQFQSVNNLLTLDVTNNALTGIKLVPSTVQTLQLGRNKLQGTIPASLALSVAQIVDLHDNPALDGTLPAGFWENNLLGYAFLQNTALSSGTSGLPPGLEFDTSNVQSFISPDDEQTSIICHRIKSTSNDDVFVIMDPSYYGYDKCVCAEGYEGTGPTCTVCAAGYYSNNDHTSCASCADGSYSPQQGSMGCLSCSPFPLKVTNSQHTECLDFTALWIGLLVVLTVVVLPTVIAVSMVAALLVGFTVYKSAKWWQEKKVRDATLLIAQRAREEIPADLLIRYKDLSLEKTIGAGGYARVYQAMWKHTIVAVKELTGIQQMLATLEVEQSSSSSLSSNASSDGSIEKLVEEFRSEVKIMSQLHHPNVLLLVGACTEFPNLCIVTELLAGGSLYEVLHGPEAKESIQLPQQLRWMQETARGMAYLHEHDLMHRDLKSLNVLLDHVWQAKLCDFGLSRLMGDTQRNMTTGVGSILWMAPELMLQTDYSFSVDVYAWAITAWEILSPGKDLYAGIPTFQITQRVVTGMRPQLLPSWPAGVHTLLQQAWQAEPAERPTFEGICHSLDELVGGEEEDDGNDHQSKGQLKRASRPLDEAMDVDDLQSPLLG